VSGAVTYHASRRLVATGGVKPLFAHPGESYPPPNLFSDEEAYVRLWQSNCPMYTGEAAAVLGGWHFPWPDGGWEELRDTPLLLWTIDESEPWVEVWGGPGGFKVIQRVT
jgi:hypothetical protein